MFILPNFEKIAFSIGPLKIYWYGISYFVGIILAMFIAGNLEKKYNFFKNDFAGSADEQNKLLDKFYFYIILGVIFGGRIGYILFYNLKHYTQDPLEIFRVWRGGMAFHGAFLGITISLLIFSKKYKIKFLRLTDVLSYICLPGIFLGRLANFINAELLGKQIFSYSHTFFAVLYRAEKFPRHPSQIYEAVFEGLLPFVIIFFLEKKFKIFKNLQTGSITAFFLFFYGTSRFIIEWFFRLPDVQIGYVLNGFFTLGQIFCLGMIFSGIGILLYQKKRRQ